MSPSKQTPSETTPLIANGGGHGHGHGHDEHGHSHGHGHGHGHGDRAHTPRHGVEAKIPIVETSEKARSAFNSTQRKLMLATLFALFFMCCEIVGGYMSSSLSIINDALHLLSDVAGFLISIVAVWLGTFPASSRMSYGFQRAEIVGAIISCMIIWILTGCLLYEAVARTIDCLSEEPKVKVDGKMMFIIACIGLVVNLILMKILGHNHGHGGHGHSHGHSHGPSSKADHKEHTGHGHGSGSCGDDDDDDDAGLRRRQLSDPSCVNEQMEEAMEEIENVNVAAAYRHAVGDLIQSIGVCVAGAVIWAKPEYQIADPLTTFLFAPLVLWATIDVLKSSMHVLMEGTPEGVEPSFINEGLSQLPSVSDVHDLHIWSLTVGKVALSVHLVAENTDEALEEAQAYLRSHNIDHTTIQVEKEGKQYAVPCDEPCA